MTFIANELMPAAEFSALLVRERACNEAMTWAEGKSLAKVWQTCKRGDWMLWLVGRTSGTPGWATRKQVVSAACDCAELSLKFVKAGEDRPRIAIETARRWVRDEATLDEVRKASRAAYAAYAAAAAAADDADVAAYAYAAAAAAAADAAAAAAAAAADDADVAAYAYAAAAYAAAAAAYAYADAAADAARTKVLAQCADLVRKSIPVPYEVTHD